MSLGRVVTMSSLPSKCLITNWQPQSASFNDIFLKPDSHLMLQRFQKIVIAENQTT